MQTTPAAAAEIVVMLKPVTPLVVCNVLTESVEADDASDTFDGTLKPNVINYKISYEVTLKLTQYSKEVKQLSSTTVSLL